MNSFPFDFSRDLSGTHTFVQTKVVLVVVFVVVVVVVIKNH